MKTGKETNMETRRRDSFFSDGDHEDLLGVIHQDRVGKSKESHTHRRPKESMSLDNPDFETSEQCLERANELHFEPPAASPRTFWRAPQLANSTPINSRLSFSSSANSPSATSTASSKTSLPETSSASQDLEQEEEEELVVVFDYSLSRQVSNHVASTYSSTTDSSSTYSSATHSSSTYSSATHSSSTSSDNSFTTTSTKSGISGDSSVSPHNEINPPSPSPSRSIKQTHLTVTPPSNGTQSLTLQNFDQEEEELVEVFDYNLDRQANTCATGSESNYSYTYSEYDNSSDDSTIINSELSHISLIELDQRFELPPRLIKRTYESSSDSECSSASESLSASERSTSESSGNSEDSLSSSEMTRNDEIMYWILHGKRVISSSHSTPPNYCEGEIVTLPSEDGEVEGNAGPVESNVNGLDETLEVNGTETGNADSDCQQELDEKSNSMAATDEERHGCEKSGGAKDSEACLENQGESQDRASSMDEVTTFTQETTRSLLTTDCNDTKTSYGKRVPKKRNMLREVGRFFGRCFGISK